jgi:UrcA family protein
MVERTFSACDCKLDGYQLVRALLVIAVVCLPMVAAHAETDAPSIRVTFRDLDIASAAGTAAAYGRIQGAAKRVCEPLAYQTGTHLAPPAYERCVRDAVATTVQKVNQPGLTLYAARGGSKPSER